MKVVPPFLFIYFFLSVVLGIDSCFTQWIKTLSNSTGIIDAQVSHLRSMKWHYKMAVVDVHTGQRVVTEFLTMEGSGLIEVYRCLQKCVW
jgi:hypothetical protein